MEKQTGDDHARFPSSLLVLPALYVAFGSVTQAESKENEKEEAISAVAEPSGNVAQPTPYPVRLEMDYPKSLSRLTTVFRLFLAIPQWVVLYFVSIAELVVWFLSWWIILFTGKYPKGMFDFSAKFLRWYTRFSAYTMFLTDRYPPFSGRP